MASIICHLLQIPTIFAAMSAVVNMKPSVVQSWKNALEQVLVHLLGLFVAFAIGLTLGINPLTIGLTTVLVIWLIGRLDLTGGTLMGVLSAIFILSSSSQDFFMKNALIRSGAILIGLGVALVVNYFVMPPRYGQRLRAVLRELSGQVTEFFGRSVQAFVIGLPVPEEELENTTREINEKLKLSRDLLKRYREQAGRVRPRATKAYNNPAFLGQYLEYLAGLAERNQGLNQVLAQRLERRESRGNPQLSIEFQGILEMISQGSTSIQIMNSQLEQAVFEDLAIQPQPKTRGYWEELALIMEEWHEKVSGSYYLYALVEVGVVIAEIKWATEKTLRLFTEMNYWGNENV